LRKVSEFVIATVLFALFTAAFAYVTLDVPRIINMFLLNIFRAAYDTITLTCRAPGLNPRNMEISPVKPLLFLKCSNLKIRAENHGKLSLGEAGFQQRFSCF